MENIEKFPKNIQNIKYFFSLILEDYFGDKEELMTMAEIDEEDLKNFFQ
ncbi:MAG TPA: hypothetical protein VIO58_10730 [Candidatus Methanoperedens sp.]